MTGARASTNTIGLFPALAISIAMLVVVSVGSVAATGLYLSRTIVADLGSKVMASKLTILEQTVRGELDAIVAQSAYVAKSVAADRPGFGSLDRLGYFAGGSLAAAHNALAIHLADADGKGIHVQSGNRKGDILFQFEPLDIADDPLLVKAAREALVHDTLYWGEPIHVEETGETFLNLSAPIRKGQDHLGFMTVAISTKAISDAAAHAGDEQHTVFLLYGENKVVAHSRLDHGDERLSIEKPLLGHDEIDDPVLSKLDEAHPFRHSGITPPKDAEALELEIDGKRHYIFTKALHGYGNIPLLIGVHNEASAFDASFDHLHQNALISAGLLLASIIVAGLLSRLVSRPVERTAQRALAIENLDFDRIAPLERSRLREIDELATAFNAMLVGLKSFGRYMPRNLVAQLIKEHRVGAGSEERELTVMFTDIADFSTACEAMSATEVAELINHHLTLVCACIEREGGTIDKYIGDAVMAFWGAPDTIHNTALSACRAALAIRSAIEQDNIDRQASGLAPVRLRIGIHTGPLVVGDIGTPTRTNYTVVGDVVNGCQRLEALGKEVAPDAEVTILLSGTTAEFLPPDIPTTSEGTFRVKGKEQRIEAFRLT